jgi:hypothetical protein
MTGNPQDGQHRWSCAEAEVPCDHAEMGCPALIKRSDLKDHLTSCLFEQFTPYLNIIKGEIEELKKDRDTKSKQIDSLLRAQARLNDRLANIRPFSAFTTTAGRVSTARPGASDLETDARLVRAMEIVRQRRQARLNAQPITESVPERPAVSGTPQTPAQTYATPLATQRRPGPVVPLPSRDEEFAQLIAEHERSARQAARQIEILASDALDTVANLRIARPRRAQAPARISDPEDGNAIRPSRPITPPDRSSTPPPPLPHTQSRLHAQAPESNIQPPSTASTQRDSEVSTTMATQGSIISSSSPANISDVETSDFSDTAATLDSTVGGSSHQSTDQIALTGNSGLNISVSSSIVPGDSISNFRFLASADNRSEANTSRGANGLARLSEARRETVETLATSSIPAEDSLTTNHPVPLDAPGTTRATAIDVDSDS